MTSAPDLRPTTVSQDSALIADALAATVADLRIVDVPDLAVTIAPPAAADDTPLSAPSALSTLSALSAPPAGETHAPAIVTRLVAVGLLIVSAAVVVSALGHERAAPRVHTVPTSEVAVSKPVPLPGTVHILGAQRSGDVVLLRVDAVGESGQQSVVVEPGARVVLSRVLGSLPAGVIRLQQFLDAAATSAVHQPEFTLGYDATGAVRTISLTTAG